MQVRRVGMGVPHRLVRVLVNVRLRPFVAAMGVLMMLVVSVVMGVHEPLVLVLVVM